MVNGITFYSTLIEILQRNVAKNIKNEAKLDYSKEISPYNIAAYIIAKDHIIYQLRVTVNNYCILQYSIPYGRDGYTQLDTSNSKNIKRLILDILKEPLGKDWIVLALLLDDYIDPDETVNKYKTSSSSSSNHNNYSDGFGDNLIDASIASAMFMN